MADLGSCKLEDLVTVEQFSELFNVRNVWVLARIKDKTLKATKIGKIWLIDVSDMRGYMLLTDYAKREGLNVDSLRRRLSNGWLQGRKLGAYWFINPGHLKYIPEGYVPVKTYAERANIHYQTAMDNCRLGKIEAIKHGKYWFVKEDKIPCQTQLNI